MHDHHPPSVSRQVKLRTSCNRCGIAKVKCDRGKPECARCITHGKPCVYGLSRKNGRPSRLSRRVSSHLAGASQALTDGDGMMLGLELFLGMSDLSSVACNAGIAPVVGFHGGDWVVASQPEHALSSPIGASFQLGPPAMAWAAPPPALGPCGSMASSVKNQGRDDCLRDTYEILRCLSFRGSEELDPPAPYKGTATASTSFSPSSTIVATTTASAGKTAARASMMPTVPLDHVLGISREAIKRLEPLLSGPCTGSADFVYLCASIISRILTWYDWAASCPETAAWAHVTAPDPYRAPLQPLKMALGLFSIDDADLQTSFRIHVVLVELKRAARLIDRFTASSPCGQEDTKALYETHSSHLSLMHAQIVNRARERLRQFHV